MKSISLTISTDIKELKEVENFIEDISEHFNLQNTYYGNILVALSEAVENSIIHGNKNKKEKKITITLKQVPKGLCFTVQDEGDGFDINNIPDPTDVKNNPEKKGSGIYLIKTLTDEMQYFDKGKKLEMIFYTTSINNEVYQRRKKQMQDYFKEKSQILEKNKRTDATM